MAQQTDAILIVEHVSKYFGGVVAVRDANMRLLAGRVTSLIGPNGAGKTTLFNAITGCIPPSEGRITFRTRDGRYKRIDRLRPDRINALGIARTFQNIRLFGNLTALENVKIGMHGRTNTGLAGAIFRPPWVRNQEREIEIAALRYLEFCGLTDCADELASKLPYGLQRRLEIA
ncbi:MAG: ATP-binding cassette domain-containing protein, partial [Candidatus Sumerlaeaceae bacterium]|nr:ATP-binding cassette domain-containing protein [Candidatus Sumerlaeaceae bacterium]